MATFYEILGVAKTATEAEIRTAYRKQALAYHPDRAGDDPIKKEKYLQAQNAYQVLTDFLQREKYNLCLEYVPTANINFNVLKGISLDDIRSHFEAVADAFCGEEEIQINRARRQARQREQQIKQNVLSQLAIFGLTDEDLQIWERRPSGSPFGYSHGQAIGYLLTREGLSGKQAVKAVSRLDDIMADLLVKLYFEGLRGNDLRAWQCRSYCVFDDAHAEAITFLMREQGHTGKQAVQAVNLLDGRQAALLQELYSEGLTGDDLRIWKAAPGGTYFYDGDVAAVRFLMTVKGYTGADAVQAITGLDEERAKLLVKLYDKGMRGKDLQAWQPRSSGYPFCEALSEIVELLLQHTSLSPAEIMLKVNYFTQGDAEKQLPGLKARLSQYESSKTGRSP